MFKISVSEFGTLSMCRCFHACTHEFLTMVTEGVVHGVYVDCDSIVFWCNILVYGDIR